MSVATLLRSRLTTVASALVSTRVYPNVLPQSPTYMALTYQRISSTGQKGSSTLRDSRFQVDCWGEYYDSVGVLAATVKTALEEWHNNSATPGVLWAVVVNELDDFEPDAKVPSRGIYRVSIDVMLTTIGD